MNGKRGRPNKDSVTKPRDNGKHPGGRPPKYDNPAKMQIKVDEYFEECKAEKRIPLLTGLALALGMEWRTLRDYQAGRGGRDVFAALIKRARVRIEDAVTGLMLTTAKPVGAIFYLKNCHDWQDKSEVITTGPVLTDEELEQRIKAILEADKPPAPRLVEAG